LTEKEIANVNLKLSPKHSHWYVSLCGALLVALLAPIGVAQKSKANPLAPRNETPSKGTEEKVSSGHELTPGDLEAFLDGLVPLQIEREDIAGAVISVVKDGRPFFAKGYGFADVEKRVPVSPDSTLFRPGSISKLFNWTSIMQQVEQGKLDLDRDVNDYLDFRVPPAFGKPITLRNIMTHTPGFEETLQELFVANAAQLTPLDQYLKAHMPARIFPPGTTPAYSNYATALAGYILQRVSGEPFDDYIDHHIFQPLAMAHCTTRQPLPEALKPMMSNGYTVASEPAKSFEFVEATPAGSSSVTATDMQRFMIMHLEDGQYNGVQILRPETARLMHSRQFVNLPDMNAMDLGFYEETRNGHRIIGHAGDTQYFHSDLHLILDSNIGFFISYNSAGKGETSAREAVWHAFLDRYFPYQPPKASVSASAAADAQLVSGRYISSRRPEKTILKILNVADQPKVSVNADNTISVDMLKDPNGKPKKLEEIGPLMFREMNGQDRVGFKRDDAGNLVLVIDFPFFVFQHSPWNVNSSLNLAVIIIAVSLFVLTLLLWPVAALLRRHYGQALNASPERRRVRLLTRLVCLVNLVFLAAFLIFFSMSEKDIGILSPKFNPVIRIIQLVGWLGIVGTIAALVNAMRAWKESSGWLWGKIGETLIAVACLLFVFFVFNWNMLHWSLRY
jgi:CubicO group peptidase (beta-lactamase class C family)